jgi:hypothetical protein
MGNPGTQEKVSREAVVRSLNRIGPLDPQDEHALALPELLFDVGREGMESYSSDPELSASSFEGCFYLGLPLPERIPDYALSLSMRGSALRCTLVDRRRGILVNAQVGSAGEEGDWSALTVAVRSALRARKSAGDARFIKAGEDAAEPVY